MARLVSWRGAAQRVALTVDASNMLGIIAKYQQPSGDGLFLRESERLTQEGIEW